MWAIPQWNRSKVFKQEPAVMNRKHGVCSEDGDLGKVFLNQGGAVCSLFACIALVLHCYCWVSFHVFTVLKEIPRKQCHLESGATQLLKLPLMESWHFCRHVWFSFVEHIEHSPILPPWDSGECWIT